MSALNKKEIQMISEASVLKALMWINEKREDLKIAHDNIYERLKGELSETEFERLRRELAYVRGCLDAYDVSYTIIEGESKRAREELDASLYH